MKALACQLPAELGIPLSRFSRAELRREVLARGIVAQISGSTIWRWLHADALRPWSHRSWVFPRDPAFSEKAGRVLDLYAGSWQGQALGPREYVLCADEKTGIQVRRRIHPTQAPGPGRALRVEHEYKRLGTLAYLVAWDVRRAQLFGRVVSSCNIESFDGFVAQVMSQAPYASAERVFWVVEGGTTHRGQRAIDRLQGQWPKLVLVHLPIHASWLNQVEIFLSVVQRKVLTPDDFGSPEELHNRILAFQAHYQEVAKPFQWTFTRKDLAQLMARLGQKDPQVQRVA